MLPASSHPSGPGDPGANLSEFFLKIYKWLRNNTENV